MTQNNSAFQIVRRRIRDNRYSVVVLFVTAFVLLMPMFLNQLPTVHSKKNTFEMFARNQGVRVLGGETLCAALSEGEDIDILVSGNLTDLYNYQNLFQTSDLNAGIRFEINEQGQGGLVIGSNSVGGYSVLMLPKRFELGDFELSIRISNGKEVSVSYLNEKTEKVVGGLKPTCDNVIVGYGFDSSRMIRGEVNFSATWFFAQPQFVPTWLDSGLRLDWVRALLSAVFYFTAIFVAFKISTEAVDETKDSHETQDSI